MLSLLVCSACDGQAECVDSDLDGYGPGCELGEDCDPDNAARNFNCEATPAPDCSSDPTLTGCPCLLNSVTDCLDELDGVGVCLAGRTRCVNGFWGLCEGGFGPSGERCDGVDQDCDGLVDEGVVSPCGGCTPGCVGGAWGEDPVPFVPTEGTPSEGLTLTRTGELTLGLVEQSFGTVWVANSAEATVSRIDADLAVETARYPTGGSEPSRVAVDYLGDAWVLNREFGGVSSATRIAGLPGRCIDRDGDGVQTSTGPTDVRALADDECITLHVPVGEIGGVARAIAIDGDLGLDGVSGGNAWIGLHDAQAVVELDGLSGAELRRVQTPSFSPYAATFDRWGTLWMASRDGLLARIDPRPAEPTVELIEVPLPCYLLYSLAVDDEGRLLVTGFSCDRVASYDPLLDRWETRATEPSPRGVVFDPRGRFFVAHTSGLVSEIALDPLRVRQTWPLASATAAPIETIGIAVDAAGSVWTASSQGGAGDDGIATRLDPGSGEVTAQLEVGRAPHVQGDLSGTRVHAQLVPSASITHVFEGCGADQPTRWLNVHAAASGGSSGRVIVEARHAGRVEDLPGASFAPLGAIPDAPAPWALDLPEGGALELRLTLEVGGRAGAPRVRRIGVEWRCPGPD